MNHIHIRDEDDAINQSINQPINQSINQSIKTHQSLLLRVNMFNLEMKQSTIQNAEIHICMYMLVIVIIIITSIASATATPLQMLSTLFTNAVVLLLAPASSPPASPSCMQSP